MPRERQQFRKDRECKHSIRFAPTMPRDADIASIIYVGKDCLKLLGDPELIEITIEALD